MYSNLSALAAIMDEIRKVLPTDALERAVNATEKEGDPSMKKLLFTVYQVDNGYVAETPGAVLVAESMSKVCEAACAAAVSEQVLGTTPEGTADDPLGQGVRKAAWRKL
jgi:hypothetical protein